MNKLVVIKTVPITQKRVVGHTLKNEKILILSYSKKRLYHGEIEASGEYIAISDTISQNENPTGLTWDGKNLYLADRIEKKIFSIDIKMKKLELVLSLKEFEPDKIPLVFLTPHSEITDISWGEGLLWFTCMAGYSSSFYGVDISNNKIICHFRTRGPEPEGISFDSQKKHLWILDASNRELSQFLPNGKWTGRKLQVPLEKPIGLTIDDNDIFWITDLKSNELYSLKEE